MREPDSRGQISFFNRSANWLGRDDADQPKISSFVPIDLPQHQSSGTEPHQPCWNTPITFPAGSRNLAVISGASAPIGCTISPPLATMASTVADTLSTMM